MNSYGAGTRRRRETRSKTLDSDRFKGYRGAALESLERFDVGVWSDVEIESTRGRFVGIILPRSETADD
jgi:hypothetical protein